MRKVSTKQVQWLRKELPLLEKAGVVTPETADYISTYYRTQTQSGLHWAVMAFAVLGSLLIGAGIILLFAHNWDALGRPARAILSFCPLLLGGLISLAALLKGDRAFCEAAAVFHALAVGASIALIGQTYHISSSLPNFFLAWSLLILPLSFLLRSSGVRLIYLALLCGWSGAAQQQNGHAAAFWLLALPPTVWTVRMIRTDRDHPETLLNIWGLLLTGCIALGLVFERTVPGLWIVAYAALFSTCALLGMRLYPEGTGWSNPLKTIGIIGTVILAYLFTFLYAWHDIGWDHLRIGWRYRAWGPWLDGTITLGLLLGWITAVLKTFRRDSLETITLVVFPAVSLAAFILGSCGNAVNLLNALLFNGFMLLLGILYIVLGCRRVQLRKMNGGMGILALLLITRFFDDDFGFLARGIIFILLGICFLSVNLIMLRRKKRLEAAA